MTKNAELAHLLKASEQVTITVTIQVRPPTVKKIKKLRRGKIQVHSLCPGAKIFQEKNEKPSTLLKKQKMLITVMTDAS